MLKNTHISLATDDGDDDGGDDDDGDDGDFGDGDDKKVWGAVFPHRTDSS